MRERGALARKALAVYHLAGQGSQSFACPMSPLAFPKGPPGAPLGEDGRFARVEIVSFEFGPDDPRGPSLAELKRRIEWDAPPICNRALALLSTRTGGGRQAILLTEGKPVKAA